MISSFFGVKRETKQQQPVTTIRFDRRLLEQTTNPKPTPNFDPLLLDLILKKLEVLVCTELGQPSSSIQALSSSLKQQTVQYLSTLSPNTEPLERSLIETKQKYNQLVDTLNTNRMKLKTFHDAVFGALENLLIVVGELLMTKEFEMPLKHIHKGIADLSVETVDKYMNYVGKIFAQEHAKAIDRAVDKTEKEKQEEVRQLKAMAKGLEGEVGLLKQAKKSLEKQIKQYQNTKKQLSERLKQAQQAVKLAEQLGGQQLKEKSHHIQKQMTAKLKSSQQRIQFLESTNKQIQTSNQSLHSRIESLEKFIEQQKLEHRYEGDAGQKKYLASIKKLNQEKLALQQKIAQLGIQMKKLKTQQSAAVAQALSESTKLTTFLQNQLDKLTNQLAFTKSEFDKLAAQQKNMVDREVIRGLVEGFMDEGKEWSIKKDIQRNLFTLLGVTKSDKQEPKKSGWFGLF